MPIGFSGAIAAFSHPVLILAGIGVGVTSSVIPYVCDQLAMSQLPRNTYAAEKAAAGKTGFVPIAVRWVVERSNDWMERCKSLTKNFERTLVNAKAQMDFCFVRLMKRLAVRS